MSSRRPSLRVAALAALPCLAVASAFADPAPTMWGSHGTLPGQFDLPVAVAAHGDRVYVADYGNHRIQQFTREGAFVREWGATGADRLEGPSGVAIGPGGDVYVSDFVRGRVEKFSADGVPLGGWTVPTSRAGMAADPAGIAEDRSGRVLVSDADGGSIAVFDAAGTSLGAWDVRDVQGAWAAPWGVATDGAGGTLVADRATHQVLWLDGAGARRATFGRYGAGVGELRGPSGVAWDGGRVYVTDVLNRRVQAFGTDGSVVGAWPVSEGVSGIAASGGDVYVTDVRASRVLRLTDAPLLQRPVSDVFELQLAGPNPCRDGIAMRLELPAAGRVRADVLDLGGRRVRTLADGTLDAGSHALAWDGAADTGRAVPAGMYFVLGRFESAGHSGSVRRRVVVLP